jgi:hypothetical protein
MTALYIAAPVTEVTATNGAINVGGGLFIDDDEIQVKAGTSLKINHDNSVDLILNYGGGNVGIGVTSPAQELEIDGNILIHTAAGRAISMETPSSDSDGYDLTMHSGNAYDTGGVSGNDGGDLYLRGGNGDTNFAQLSGGNGGSVYLYGGDGEGVEGAEGNVILAHTGSVGRGKVGIGTASPQEELTVIGDAQITGYLIVDSCTLYVNSNNDRVGIGCTGTPDTKLHIGGTDAAMTLAEASSRPADPDAGTEVRTFVKDDKLYVQFKDGVTVKYFYIDLTATSDQSWKYTTSAP